MYILKNIIKDLSRNKIHNLLNIAIIILMISFIAIFLIIYSSTNISISKYKNKLGSEVEIKINKKELMGSNFSTQLSKVKDITTDNYLEFAKSEYVEKAFFTGNMMAYIEGLNEENNKYEIHSDKMNINVAVSGYSNYDNLLELADVKMKEGNIFKDDTECLVSEEFVKNNGLRIGDEINVFSGIKGEESKSIKLKIVGVYENKFSEALMNNQNNDSSDGIAQFADVLTTYNAMANLERKVNSTIVDTKAKFLLKDSNSKKSFEKDLRDKGLSNIYTVVIDEEAYRKYILPLESIKNSAFTVTFGVFAIGSILLIINSILSLKKIKYEIGVLRLTGISKLKIVKHFIYECSIMVVISLILGLSIGLFLSRLVFNYIFEAQKEINVSYIVNLSVSDVFIIILVAFIILILTSIVKVYNVRVYNIMEVINNRD